MSTSSDKSWIFEHAPQYLFISELLEKLQQAGIRVDIDHYTSIQTVLQHTKSDISPEELCGMLCPIFVNSSEEQELFYKLFQECTESEENLIRKLTLESFSYQDESPQVIKKLHKLKQYKVVFALATILLLAGSSYVFWQQKEPLLQNVETHEIIIKSSKQPIFQSEVNPKASGKEDITDENDIQQEIKQLPDELKGQTFKSVSLEEEDISMHKAELLWWHKHKIAIKWWSIAMLIIGFLCFEAYYYARNRLMASRQLNPESGDLEMLNLALKDTYSIKYPIQNIHKLAYQLRQQATEQKSNRLDARQTIAATIQNAGVISPQFQVTSKEAEYLILISQSAVRGHQWEVFDFTLKELVKQDLSVVRFYFNEVPDKCWSEYTHKPVTLKYLQTHYPGHRLLIFGNTDSFVIDQQTHPIVSELNEWQEATFLTPKLPYLWGASEELLKGYFRLNHASYEGMKQMADYFNLSSQLLESTADQPNYLIDLEEETEVVIANLERYFLPKGVKTTDQPNLLTWIAGCCLLPQLSWELTLFVGNALSTKDNYLLTVDNLTRLSSLEWFQQNHIPDRFKNRLLADEDIIAKPLKAAVSRKLVKKVERALGKKKLKALSASTKAHLLLSKINATNTKAEVTRLTKELKQLWIFSPQVRSISTVYDQLKDTSKHFMDVWLPDQYKKYFFNKGLSFEGIRPSVRLVALALLLAIPLCSLNTSKYFCSNTIEYADECYCIEDNYKMAKLLNKNAVDLYQQVPSHSAIFTLLDSASNARQGYYTSSQNKSRVLYNKLIQLLKDGQMEEARQVYITLKSLHPSEDILHKDWSYIQQAAENQ